MGKSTVFNGINVFLVVNNFERKTKLIPKVYGKITFKANKLMFNLP